MLRTQKEPNVRAWFNQLKSKLDSAVQDIQSSLHHLSDLIRSSYMHYLLLSLRTKEGYDMTNLFEHQSGDPRTAEQVREKLPFTQLARLLQVSDKH